MAAKQEGSHYITPADKQRYVTVNHPTIKNIFQASAESFMNKVSEVLTTLARNLI